MPILSCMPHTPFSFTQGQNSELEAFPHIREFALVKSGTIRLSSFEVTSSRNLRVFYVVEGKFEWIINGHHEVLYPGELAFVLPDQEIGGAKGYFDIGAVYSLHLKMDRVPFDGDVAVGAWSHLSGSERLAIGKILVLNNLPVLKAKAVGSILHDVRMELVGQELGYITRVNQLLDALLIAIARQSTQQANSRRDFPQAFMQLERSLRKNLAHQWTVEEMAAMVGLGTTAFTEKVKSYTGFPPLHYLINIRISEAIKLLKQPGINVTDIALSTGFYSSQHFSTTFKKLTGHTPGEFRKRNSSTLQ